MGSERFFASSIPITFAMILETSAIVKRIFDPLAEYLFEEEEDNSFYAGRIILVHQAGNDATFVFESK